MSTARAQSNSDELAELLRRQAAQIEALEARVKALERELSATVPPVDPPPAALTSDSASTAAPVPSSGVSRASSEAAPNSDGDFRPRLRGRVMSDLWATSSDVTGVDYPSGTEMRIAVLGVDGRLTPLISYQMEADIANDVLRETWLKFKAPGPVTVTAGNVKPLFSLEHLSGLPRGTFLEPALPNVFAINESIGLQVERQQSNWYAGLGAFGEPPNVSLAGDEGYGIVGRLALVSLLDKDRFVHVGVSGYRKFLNADAGENFRVQQRPEIRLVGIRLSDTGRLDADSTEALTLEFAAAVRPFLLQAEYMQNWVDLRTGKATFDGAYVFGSWLVTGESRPYVVTNSTIGRVKPTRAFGQGGWGALELALRFSTLDLSDSGVFGGEERNVTLGVNWYFTERARLMANYVRYSIDDNLAVRPLGSPMHGGDAVGVRAQVDW